MEYNVKKRGKKAYEGAICAAHRWVLMEKKHLLPWWREAKGAIAMGFGLQHHR
jgi:hypothetical protein